MRNYDQSLTKLQKSLIENEDLSDNLKFIQSLQYLLGEKTVLVKGAGNLRGFYNIRIRDSDENTDRNALAIVNMVKEILTYIDETLLDQIYRNLDSQHAKQDLTAREIKKRRDFLSLYIFHYILEKKHIGHPRYDRDTVLANHSFSESTILLSNGDILNIKPTPSSTIRYKNNQYNFVTEKFTITSKRFALLEEHALSCQKKLESWKNLKIPDPRTQYLPKHLQTRFNSDIKDYQNFLEAVAQYAQHHKLSPKD